MNRRTARFVVWIFLVCCALGCATVKRITEKPEPVEPLPARVVFLTVSRLDPDRLPVERLERLFGERLQQIFAVVLEASKWNDENASGSEMEALLQTAEAGFLQSQGLTRGEVQALATAYRAEYAGPCGDDGGARLR